MNCLTQIAHFIEEGGLPVYPIILFGVASHARLAQLRAWRGQQSRGSLRDRLFASTFGAFASIALALAGLVWDVRVIPGAIADATVGFVYKLLDESLNVVYLGLGFAFLPTIVMVRIIFFEMRVRSAMNTSADAGSC
jgi:hypothetical protein